MKNFALALPKCSLTILRILLTIVLITVVLANFPLNPSHAEMESDPSSQVSDWIADAKDEVWGEYPTIQDPWPVHEAIGDLKDLDLPSRSNAKQSITPDLSDTREVSAAKAPTPTPTLVPTPTPTPTIAPPPPAAADWLAEFVRLTNAAREKNGLAPLTLNNTLCQAAEIRVAELPSSPSPHLRPDGAAFYTVLAEVNLTANYCGENYAIAPSESTAADQIVTAWLNSPTHLKNIMNSAYTGIAFAKTVVNGTVYYEQLFIG